MKPHVVAAINLSVGCFYAFSEVGTSYLDRWLKWGNIDYAFNYQPQFQNTNIMRNFIYGSLTVTASRIINHVINQFLIKTQRSPYYRFVIIFFFIRILSPFNYLSYYLFAALYSGQMDEQIFLRYFYDLPLLLPIRFFCDGLRIKEEMLFFEYLKTGKNNRSAILRFFPHKILRIVAIQIIYDRKIFF
ncbi:hypothetical protein pb186bvf_015904 [Paramecium bursaria]